jgi:hypothetical protein
MGKGPKARGARTCFPPVETLIWGMAGPAREEGEACKAA